ncbi:OmpA family protein [Paractinoplanes atraurantiacus]|nr:OmpA family protein [Actinoplanes atraurantiacus]
MAGRGAGQAGATTVLVDVSGSARVGRTAPAYAAALETYLDQAIGREDVVSIGSFDGSASTVRWALQDHLTKADANREENREKQRANYKECLKQAAVRAVSRPAQTDKSDIGGAINAAAADGPGTVVVATDGIGNTGCLSLASPSAGKSRWIDDLVDQCPGRDGWPSALAGKNLVMLGVGQPADGVPPPTTGSVEFLQRLWQRTCLAARARSCEISTAPVARGDGAAETARTDPPVTFVADDEPPPISPGPVFNLSSEELFDLDSADLRPGAEARLRALADDLRRRDPIAIHVAGHTDSRGSAAHNLGLSQRRAAGVRAVLTAAGLPHVTSAGAGEADPLCTTATLPNGQWNEPCLQRDRRVEITMKVKDGPA